MVWTKFICLVEDYHSDESTLATTIKNNTNYEEANVMNMFGLQNFSYTPLMASEERMFEYLFENLPFMLPWQPIKFSD